MPKAIIIKKNGGPEVLELQDVKVGAPGPDEIKVTNHAIGLNYIDTYHRSGLYPLKLPSGIGLEAAGKVEEVGSVGDDFDPNIHEAVEHSGEGDTQKVEAVLRKGYLFQGNLIRPAMVKVKSE